MSDGEDIDNENEMDGDNIDETSIPSQTYSSDDSLKILDFSKGMSDQFLIYANEVIGYRAIPDIRDGLKPVHRRILYGMYTSEYRSSDKPKKSAQIVGKVMGAFHPHGDASIYSAMVRMAQPFSMNIKFVDGSGNWGSRDGLSAAAMRYTECRMTSFAEDSFFEAIKKDVVHFLPTYDGLNKEPLVLPVVVPTILLNSLSGIAVGLATDILPHNLGEVVDCLVRFLNNQNLSDHELIGDLAPDFPTGCQLAYDREALLEIYKTGQGKPVRTRGVYHIEDENLIVFTEIPFQASKKTIIESIGDLCDQKTIEGVIDVRDESTAEVRLVIEISNRTTPEIVVAQLFKHTLLESSYKANFTVLIDGVPNVVSVRRIIEEFVKFRINCIKKEITFDLNQAEATLHIKEGLKVVHDNLDRVIQIIRNSSGDEESKPQLMNEFKLSERQAESILAMRLGNISRIQGHKVDEEIKELMAKISDLKSFLEDEQRIINKIKDMAIAIKNKYNVPRRTKLVGGFSEADTLDLVVEEDMVLLFTSDNKIKATRISEYRTQRRGGQGSFGANTEKDVYTKLMVRSNTKSTLLIFTNKGNCFWVMAYKIPLTNKQNKPISVDGLLNPLTEGGLQENETVVACVSIQEFDEGRNIVILSESGLMKRLKLPWFSRFRKKAYSIYPCADLKVDVFAVRMVDSNTDLMMFSKNGQALRFNINKIREMENRTAMGVRTMRLKESDKIIGFNSVRDNQFVLHITEQGYGKITPTTEFSEKKTRTASGVAYCKLTPETGVSVIAIPVDYSGNIIVMTSNSKTVRIMISSIRVCGRSARGVTIQKMMEDERVVACAFVPEIEGEEDQNTPTPMPNIDPKDLENDDDDTNEEQDDALIDTSDLGEIGEDNDGHKIIDDMSSSDEDDEEDK